MATDDDPPSGGRPPTDPGRESRDMREASEKLNERLTERIRSQNTTPPDDKLNETIRQRLEHLVPELVKKTFQAGMGAVFSTEEGIRRIARESLPEVVGYAANAADGAKDKVFEIVARETREFLSNLNLTEEIAKILTTLSFEIKTEIRFIPNSERLTGAEPDVKASVRLKRNDKYVGGDEKDKDTKEAPRETKPETRDAKDNGDKDIKDRDSRARMRFWRREGENTAVERAEDDDDSGHDR
jgi:hypothetical protein